MRRLHENEVVPVLVAEMDHQPVRRATHCLNPGRDLLVEAVMVVGGRASQAERTLVER